MLDSKVGLESHDKGLNGPSEEYRFYHGTNGEPLQGNDMVRCVDKQ